jgi:nicotinamidase-related amidase
VIDLCQEGYIPVIVEDCVSSRAQNDKEIALVRMKQEGAIITTFESILFELLGDSKAPEFKSISKIVK